MRPALRAAKNLAACAIALQAECLREAGREASWQRFLGDAAVQPGDAQAGAVAVRPQEIDAAAGCAAVRVEADACAQRRRYFAFGHGQADIDRRWNRALRVAVDGVAARTEVDFEADILATLLSGKAGAAEPVKE